jgi:putative transcriptional regulator
VSGLRGQLLVASPLQVHPTWHHTVILLLEHGEEGAVGVVLNRPTEMEVAEPLPLWSHLATEPQVVFIGGPCERSSAICLGRGQAPAIEGWSPLFGDLGTVDLNLGPSALPGLSAVRVFAGYAGWAPGQLEGELEEGSWVTCERRPGDALTDEPDELWAHVLERQPGLVRLLARAPSEPTLN